VFSSNNLVANREWILLMGKFQLLHSSMVQLLRPMCVLINKLERLIMPKSSKLLNCQWLMEDNQLQSRLLDQDYAFISVYDVAQNVVLTEETTIGPTSNMKLNTRVASHVSSWLILNSNFYNIQLFFNLTQPCHREWRYIAPQSLAQRSRETSLSAVLSKFMLPHKWWQKQPN